MYVLRQPMPKQNPNDSTNVKQIHRSQSGIGRYFVSNLKRNTNKDHLTADSIYANTTEHRYKLCLLFQYPYGLPVNRAAGEQRIWLLTRQRSKK
jgi:hypothetical protein